jgi:hypothetical protein
LAATGILIFNALSAQDGPISAQIKSSERRRFKLLILKAEILYLASFLSLSEESLFTFLKVI